MEVYAREDGAVLLACFVAYLMAVTAVSQPRWRLGIVCVLLVLVAGNLTAGWLNFKGRWDFHLVPGFSRSFPPGRIGGFFNNPNHLAAFLSFVVFLATGVMLFARIHIASRLLLGFGVLAMLAGVVLTISRGAMLGLAVGGVVFLLLALWVVWRTRRPLFKWLVLSLLLVCGAVGGALYKVNEDAMLTRQLSTPLGEDMRTHIWRAALAQHAESPWIGVGARMFYDGGITHRDPETPAQTGDSLFAHNEYLQTLADYGWIGLVLVVLVLLTHLANGLRYLRWFVAEKFATTGMLSSNTLALTLGGIAALAATLVHAVFEFHGHVAAIAVTGAIILGLLANPGIESDVFKSRRVWGLRFVMKLTMLAASAALIYGVATFGVADAQAAVARVEARNGVNAAVLRHVASATEMDPRNAELAYQHGTMLMESVRQDTKPEELRRVAAAAVTELTRATTLNPWNFRYQLELAAALDAAAEPDEALQAIRRALTLAPLYEAPRMALGMHHHQLQQFEQAELAYLWAGEAKAMIPEGHPNWLETYRLLLSDTAALAERERAARSAHQNR